MLFDLLRHRLVEVLQLHTQPKVPQLDGVIREKDVRTCSKEGGGEGGGEGGRERERERGGEREVYMYMYIYMVVVVLLCCLALFIVSPLFNHVHTCTIMYMYVCEHMPIHSYMYMYIKMGAPLMSLCTIPRSWRVYTARSRSLV